MMTLNETSVVHLYSKDTHPVLLTAALVRFGFFRHLLSH